MDRVKLIMGRCKNAEASMILKAKCENTKHAVGPIMSKDEEEQNPSILALLFNQQKSVTLIYDM